MGHSGDSDEIPFVNSSSPPANDKERLQVLKVQLHTCDRLREPCACIVGVSSRFQYATDGQSCN